MAGFFEFNLRRDYRESSLKVLRRTRAAHLAARVVVALSFLSSPAFPAGGSHTVVPAKKIGTAGVLAERPFPSRLYVAEQEEVYALRQGETRRREIAGGQKHTYIIALTAGQFARLVIEQLGTDLTVTTYRPDGQKLLEFNGAPWPRGAEIVSIPGATSGDYKLEINSPEKLSPPGSYEIRAEYIRQPTPADKQLMAAEEVFAEALRGQRPNDQEAWKQSLQKYERAAQLWREGGDARGEARALRGIASLHRDPQYLPEAERYFKRALALWQEMKDLQGEAYTLLEWGGAVRDLGSAEKALGHYEQALKIFRETDNRLGEAAALYNIGRSYALVGEMRKALEHYRQALALQQAHRDRAGELSTLNAMTGAHNGLGEPDVSLKLAEEVAKIWGEAGDQVREALAINNAGLVYHEWGNWQKALDEYRRSLAKLPSMESLRADDCRAKAALSRCMVEAAVLDNMGALHADMGEPRRALEVHEKSLVIRNALGIPRGRGTTLARIGYAYFLSGETQKALDKYSEALDILKGADAKGYYANTLTVMGMAYVAQADYPKALEHFNRALAVQQELQDVQGQAITFDKLGHVYSLTGESAAAFKNFDQALAIWRRVRDPHGEAITLYNIARAEASLGKLPEARAHVERAISNVEALRTAITSQKLRTSYFVSKQDYYGLLVDLRMRLHDTDASAGHDVAALEAAERARARGLVDILTEAHVDIRQGVADPELVMLEQTLRRKLSDKVAAARRPTPSGGGQATDRLAAALGKEIDELSSQYDEVRARIRSQSPRYAELTQPRPLSLQELQRLLDDDTLLLEYALGDERSYLWVVGRTSRISSHILPRRSQIEAAAARLMESVTAPEPVAGETPAQYGIRVAEAKSRYLEESAALSEMILGPASDRLGKKRLLVVGDGALQYVPFGALPTPVKAVNIGRETTTQAPGVAAAREPLVADHELVEIPSASTLVTLRAVTGKRRPFQHQVAVLADPVFSADDWRILQAKKAGRPQTSERGMTSAARLQRALRDGEITDASALSRLPFTQMEAEAIMSIIHKGEGMAATGFEANYETATGGQLGKYRVVHFATHGLIDAEQPELSGLVLSLFDRRGRPKKYGFLRLPDIYNLDLPVELVVLSACRTGLGKQIRGEGLVGLTRGFMYAGAPRVVSSLWRVDDESTAELMKRFYHHMFRGQLPPAAALREAQQDIRSQKRWSYPYYWAAFVLQGEWK